VEQANSIILRFDTRGRLSFVNAFAADYFGFTREEMVGRNIIGTIVPETETSGRDLARMIQDLGERPELYAANENENMLRNGERVWIAWSNSAVRDADGKVAHVLSIGNDITGRKYAEEALRARHRDVAALHRLTETMLDAGAPLRGLAPAAGIMAVATGFAMVAVALRDRDRDVLFCRAAHGLPSDSAARAAELSLWDSTAGGVVRTGRTLAVENLELAPQYADPWLEGLGAARAVLAPMPGPETVDGVLVLLDPRPGRVDEDLISRSEAFARHLARLVAFGGAR
jgi:PAS domain S-box-containing protein